MKTRIVESFRAARNRVGRMLASGVVRVAMVAGVVGVAMLGHANHAFATTTDTTVTPFDPGVDVGGSITNLGTYFANNLGAVFGVFIGLVAFSALWAWGRRAAKAR